jgi:hypothetical protein
VTAQSRKGRKKKMKSIFLTITLAIGTIFVAQQVASAKSHTGTAKTNAPSKKHHKKHKTTGMHAATPAAQAVLAA